MMNRLTVERFRHAVCQNATYGFKWDVLNACIPTVGGRLGQNNLKGERLSYDALIDMAVSGLAHPDYHCYQSYGPLGLSFDVRS